MKRRALAVALAALVRFANILGKLTSVGAIGVLLGGFGSDLGVREFATILCILLFDGLRLFFTSHEMHGCWMTSHLPHVLASHPLLRHSFGVAVVLSVAGILLIIQATPAPADDSYVWDWKSIVPAIAPCALLVPRALIFLKLLIWRTASSKEHFRVFYYFATSTFQLLAAGLSCSLSLTELNRLDSIPSPYEAEFVALVMFFILVPLQCLLFILARCSWEIVTYTPLLFPCCQSQCLIVTVAESEFLESVYNTVIRDGPSSGLSTDLIGFLKQKLDSPNDQGTGMLTLKAICTSGRGRRGRRPIAKIGSREVIHRLFDLMSPKYPLQWRETAVYLVLKLTEEPESYFEVGMAVASSSDGEHKPKVTLLVEALHPDINESVLASLRKLAKFNGTSSASPASAEFDDTHETAQSQWKEFLLFKRKQIPSQDMWKKTAKLLRLQLVLHASEYLMEALSCQSKRLQCLAVDILIDLCTYGNLPHRQHGTSMTKVLFELLEDDEELGAKAAVLLDLLSRSTAYQELFMEVNASSGSNAILAKLSQKDMIRNDVKGKHTMSILAELCLGNYLSRRQRDMVDVVHILGLMVTCPAAAEKGWKVAATKLTGALIWYMDHLVYQDRIRELSPDLKNGLAEILLTQAGSFVRQQQDPTLEYEGEAVTLLVESSQENNDEQQEATGILCGSLLNKDKYFSERLTGNADMRALLKSLAERELGEFGVPRFWVD